MSCMRGVGWMTHLEFESFWKKSGFDFKQSASGRQPEYFCIVSLVYFLSKKKTKNEEKNRMFFFGCVLVFLFQVFEEQTMSS